MFLMVVIPVLVILIVKLTASVTVGDVFISVESVALSETSVERMVGDSLDLSYTIYPETATNQEVQWISSNEDAATVDTKGHVDFVGIGSGNITVITKDGNMRSQCSFYVTDKVVHRVELSAPQNYVYLNETLQLKKDIFPYEALNHEVIYSSDHEEIATVDTNGLVTGVQVGHVKITVTTVDGHKTDFVLLSVIKPVTSLRVPQNEVITSLNSAKIEYIVEPEDATNKNVTFEVDNPEVAEVNDIGVIKFKKQGEVNVTITTEDKNLKQKIKYIFTDGYAYELKDVSPTIDIEVGEVQRILYSTVPQYLPRTNVEFSSDAENIASVDSNGYIQGIKGGNTVIWVKVKKNSEEWLAEPIIVNVASPIEEIVEEDGITADKVYMLTPVSKPDDATNTTFLYQLNERDRTKATITQDGVVNFTTSQHCTIEVTIIASDNPKVTKKVRITYTAGMASQFKLNDNKITLNYGNSIALDYSFLPTNATKRPMKLSVKENHPLGGKGNVVEILEDGRIHATAGGEAIVKVEFTLYDGNAYEEECQVSVIRRPSQININLDIEHYKNQYITSHNIVEFAGEVLPADATEREIVWTVNDTNIAFIRGNEIIFNQAAVITLTATIGDVSNSVDIYYVGTNPVFAEVQAVKDGERMPIPEKIMAGESFEVEISSILPSFTTNPPISLQATNSNTNHSSGKVIIVDETTVTGNAGGSATLVVYISDSIRLTYSIVVERKPDSVKVLQAGMQTTLTSISLVSDVSPSDCTNKNVKYVVNESEIAYIEDSVLTFKRNGIVNITAICEGDEKVIFKFQIEKIEKDMVHVSPDRSNITVNKGDLLAFDFDELQSLQIENNSPLTEGEEVVRIENKYLRAHAAGKANVAINTTNNVYHIEITVNELVENIILTNNLDFYSDEYVVGQGVVELAFTVSPNNAANKDISIKIVQSESSAGKVENIAYLIGNELNFTKAGEISLQVDSKDGNCSKVIKIKYTGGDAVDALLTVDENLVLNVGEVASIGVSKWIPADLTNKRMSFYEVNSSGKKVIDLNTAEKTIKAYESGETKIVVELSNGIVKEINVVVINKITDIQVEENVVISGDTYTINAVVLPKSASNTTLQYILQETQIASISENVLHFSKPGKVCVRVRSTDGTNIEKTIYVTSTMGYLSKIKLNDESVELSKGAIYRIFVDKEPADASNNKVAFKILSQQSYDGISNVIELSEDGQITALVRGSAVVRVYASTYDGSEIYADCTINVYSSISAVDIKFDSVLDSYQNQNTFITGKNEINFDFEVSPADARVLEFSCDVSNPQIARVEDKKIIFLQPGRVTITFNCSDEKVKMSKTYSFYYVGDNLIEATLDQNGIDNNTITLQAGETFEFTLSKVLPRDSANLVYAENRNDPNKQVAKFQDGILYALNGGTYSFTLYVNNLKLEQLTLIVKRDATGIEIDGDEVVYISTRYYTIYASALESDTHQNLVGFESLNNNVATVTPSGNVTFNQFGECEIKVYILDNPSVFKIVKIKYTKELQALKFNQTRDKMYAGESVDLVITPLPYDADNFEIEVTLDNYDIADLIKREGAYRLIGRAGREGEVVVTAKVVGNESITVTKTFTFYAKITNIKLDLTSDGDINGHGEYRIFGNRFLNEAEVITTYQMNATLTPASASKSLLQWTTSDESVATVDENGLVTFVGMGKVTITVQQISPYEGAGVVKTSYTFTVIDGINVWNYDQFKLAHEKLKEENKDKKENYSYMVLHEDIKLDSEFPSIRFEYNVMGNGHMLDHSKLKSNYLHFEIRRDNIIIDNVILRGIEFTDGVELKGGGKTLMIENCGGILLYNCIVENGESAVRVIAADVNVTGCIFRNCFSVGVQISRSETRSSNVVVKDCIFTSSFCGVMFCPDGFEGHPDSKVSLEGEVRFYNWSTLDQLQQGLGANLEEYLNNLGISFVAKELYKQIREIAANKGTEYAYVYNGTTYYNFSVFAFSASIVSKEFYPAGTSERSKLNSSCTYSDMELVGAINFAVVVPVHCYILSILADKPFIKPGETYIGNTALLAKIKQASRF